MPGSSGVMHEWVGTVYTMAPQVLNQIYDSKADCWYVPSVARYLLVSCPVHSSIPELPYSTRAIGVIAFLLLVDEKPFKGRSKSAVIKNISRCKYDFKAPGESHFCAETKRPTNIGDGNDHPASAPVLTAIITASLSDPSYVKLL